MQKFATIRDKLSDRDHFLAGRLQFARRSVRPDRAGSTRLRLDSEVSSMDRVTRNSPPTTDRRLRQPIGANDNRSAPTTTDRRNTVDSYVDLRRGAVQKAASAVQSLLP